MPVLLLPLLLLGLISVAQEQPKSHDSVPPRWTLAQKYAEKGFNPVDCFGGQVKIRGKRVAQLPFSVYKANDAMKCCGAIVKSARTDKHGHFFIEPLKEGEYFVQFESKGLQYVTNFAVIQSYTRCEASHVEINFSGVNNAHVQTYADINDSGAPCTPTEPNCFRK